MGVALVHEKAFRDRGSGFVIMKAFIDWHKKYIEWWKKKLKISNYGIVWISFIDFFLFTNPEPRSLETFSFILNEF